VLLAAVPLVDPTGNVQSVVCVESLPFMALHQRNLEAIATLADHIADLVWARPVDQAQGRRKEFETRLARLLRDVQAFEVSAVVAALYVRRGSPMSDIVPAVLGSSLEPSEIPFVTRDAGGSHLVYLLLPKGDEVAGRALGERVEGILRQELNLPLDRAGAAYAFHVLGVRDTVPSVMRLLAQKAHVDEKSVDAPLLG
jgi:hypothetical protein